MNSSRNPDSFRVPCPSGETVTATCYAATGHDPTAAVVLAHGAGAGQHSPFMRDTAGALAGLGFDVITFDFPYMERQRRLPDRAPILEACYAAVIEDVRVRVPSAARGLFIGGKSMGGRMATHLAAAAPARPPSGLVLFGYPLHPPGKPERRRDAHLPAIAVPVLVIQGSRDTFGTPDELRTAFSSAEAPVTLHVIEGGDHSFKKGRGGAARQAAIDTEVRQVAATWMRHVLNGAGGDASISGDG